MIRLAGFLIDHKSFTKLYLNQYHVNHTVTQTGTPPWFIKAISAINESTPLPIKKPVFSFEPTIQAAEHNRAIIQEHGSADATI